MESASATPNPPESLISIDHLGTLKKSVELVGGDERAIVDFEWLGAGGFGRMWAIADGEWTYCVFAGDAGSYDDR
jgi:hypothetical protein